MTTGSYAIWAYWPNREESAQRVAARLALMFEQLATINSAFSHWYQKAETLAESYKPFCTMPPRANELTGIVRSGEHTRYVPPQPWPELGYTVYAWNGIFGARGLSVNMDAGAYGDNRLYPNIVTIDVQPYSSANADLINASTLRSALVAIVSAWDASWGCVCSRPYTKRLYARKSFAPGDPAPPVFRSGWMTYLSAPLAGRIVPPSQAIAERLPDGGLLMRATDDVFAMENPAHLAAADAIQQALEPLQFDPRVLDAQSAQRRLGL